jgi:hypothetical protein
MKMKNKMKDYRAKYEEWWEIAKVYFQRNWRRI